MVTFSSHHHLIAAYHLCDRLMEMFEHTITTIIKNDMPRPEVWGIVVWNDTTHIFGWNKIESYIAAVGDEKVESDWHIACSNTCGSCRQSIWVQPFVERKDIEVLQPEGI